MAKNSPPPPIRIQPLAKPLSSIRPTIGNFDPICFDSTGKSGSPAPRFLFQANPANALLTAHVTAISEAETMLALRPTP